MTDTPHNLPEMLSACAAQHQHQTASAFGYGADWEGDCQAFVHVMWGLLVGGFGSAYLQFLGLDPEDRLTMTELKGSLANAPLGSSLFTKGTSPNGHTFPKSRPFANGHAAGWSTDLWRTGLVGKVPVTAARTEWGHRELGAGLSVNGNALDLSGKKPPRPKQNKRYQRIERAHTNLGHSLDSLRVSRRDLNIALATARNKHDATDVKHIQSNINFLNKDIEHVKGEMRRLENLYTHARHS
jgi:hypothetical protein